MDSAKIVGSPWKSGIEDIWCNCIKCARSFRASCGPRICNHCRYGLSALSTKHSLLGDQQMMNDVKKQSDPKGEIGCKSKQPIPEPPDGGEKMLSPKQDNESNMEQSVDYKRALMEGPKLKKARNKAKENDSRWESLPKELPKFRSTEEFVRWPMHATKGMGHDARWEYLYSLDW